MANTIVYPNAVVIHSQNTSFADSTMMCTWRLIEGTLLAISQIATLALDLVNRGLGILDVGHEGGRDPTRVGEDGGGVVEDAHEGDAGEGGGVHEARRGGEAEPAVDEDEDGGEVEEADREDDGGHGGGEPDPAPPLHGSLPIARALVLPEGTTGGETAAATASPEAAAAAERRELERREGEMRRRRLVGSSRI